MNHRRLALLFLLSVALLATAMALEQRQTVSLNGYWKFTTLDREEFSGIVVDESNWTVVQVPGDWRQLGIQHSGYAWYRRSSKLTLNEGFRPRYLRFDRIMDEGEVWLNGVKLANPGPALCDLLKYKQFGSYGYKVDKVSPYYHNYPLDWPYMFPIDHVVRPGRNQLAVRVLEDPGTPEAGITGNVHIVLTEPCYISNIRLLPPRTVSENLTANFTFEVQITNERKAFERQLSLSVFKGEALMPAGDEAHIIVPSGSGAPINLTWSFRPKFERYMARISLLNDTQTIDVVKKGFHGTVVEVRGNKFYVNGERFIFKGLNFAGPKDSIR